jgi:2'-5' RNA ligase
VRLFFALWPDEAVREQLARWSRELRRVCGGRPTRPENLHLTLAFLGSVEEARLPEVERAASDVAPPVAPLVLDQCDYWKRKRIAWAGASATPPRLEAFAADLRDAMLREGIPFDSKPFVSHITLLRDAREPKLMPRFEPIEWSIEGFALVQSVTLPEGSRYDLRKVWKG